ncbi:unnamed protein product [Euphydryas editha]|uniref:Core-binding (CB) domain-containing protein n=1 Tax=Euphydryas editha TaxID=104508 RepID=A0AAU9U0A6_EUPED|nr:unnamed protein product [Euphydryas editha]
MGEGLLDGRPSAPQPAEALPYPGHSTSATRHSDRSTSTECSTNSFRGLADFGWTEMIDHWSPREKSLFLSSWRESTINTYRPAWRKWKIWCTGKSVDFKNPNPQEVARYLAYLHNDEGLSYKTILVHKSVVTNFTNISRKTDYSSDFFIKHMLKAISVAKEKITMPPIWDPKLVIQYLMHNIPDVTNLYQVLRRTAILLLLSSGRRVHDLTLLSIEDGRYIDQGNSIIFWPRFGSKTDTANYRQSGWKLLRHPCTALDSVYWIRGLIELSKERRQENNLVELFITARGVPKAASRTVIGGWIKSVLREAGVEASPGSVKTIVNSLAAAEVEAEQAEQAPRAPRTLLLPQDMPVEQRPHYMQPRSVRSVDSQMHESEKRVKRCSCNCR